MRLLIEGIRDFLRERDFEKRLAVTPPGSLRDDMLLAVQRSRSLS